MSGTQMRTRRHARLDEPVAPVGQGDLFLTGLRFVLLGCAVALVGVLGHVAWKVLAA